jgi:hypothetical protein
MDQETIVRFFERVMRHNEIVGKVLCCVVIPDYHKLYKLEWQTKNLFTRYHILHEDPPALQCLCKKEYLDHAAFEQKLESIDKDIDKQLCNEIRPSNLAFVVFDSINVAKRVKDVVT